MMTHGYKPALSEGSIKCPIFQTSTFVFKTAEEGKAFFEVAYGLREREQHEELGLIYSRLNNPDLEILENRLCLWDDAEECAVFESGMSAITTVLLEFLKPGDVVLHSSPLYGGTDHFITQFLPSLGIECVGFMPGEEDDEALANRMRGDLRGRVKVVYVETPANPTNHLVDIARCRELADLSATEDTRPIVTVDNTYMGPIWQHPLAHGADLVMYSATKYIGGHSDVIAGAVLGSRALISRVKTLRTFLGNMAGPWTGWLLLRSLETLKVRMDQQQKNAVEVARALESHGAVERVIYLGRIKEGSREARIMSKQCEGTGAMVSFYVRGGEAGAFAFLNHLKLVKLAVSLGSTESLAQHPHTMTHAGVDPEVRQTLGITPSLVRLSVGVEHPEDLIADLYAALDYVSATVAASGS